MSESGCPRCRRPVAVAGPRCVYCGETLPLRESPKAAETTPGAPIESPERTALVLDTTPGAAALAAALGMTAAEAGYRVQRGRYLLHRILPPGEAQAEAGRLASHGLSVVSIPEQEIREGTKPLLSRGGDPDAGRFVLDPDRTERQVEVAEVLLVVWGPIRREVAEPNRGPLRGQRRFSRSGQEGEVYHLHFRDGGRPLEIDPWTFQVSDTRGRIESGHLRIRAGIERLAGATPIDRSFRFEPPALAPSGDGAAGLVDVTGGLRQQSSAGPRPKRPVADLDNLGQFRFHSSWLAAVARRCG